MGVLVPFRPPAGRGREDPSSADLEAELRLSYFEHIDEVFDDFRRRRIDLAEVSAHMKDLISELVSPDRASRR